MRRPSKEDGGNKNPPEANKGVAYVAGHLAVTQEADPVWEVLYQGVARMVPDDDPLYGAIVGNWLSQLVGLRKNGYKGIYMPLTQLSGHML
jgi:hypothetical protein